MAGKPERETNVWHLILTRALGGFLFYFGLVFLSAGTLDYWQGWVLLGATAVSALFNFFFGTGLDLARERIAPGPGMKEWDKLLFYGLFVPLNFLLIVVAALDGGRFHWTGALPAWAYLFAYSVFFASQLIETWARASNRWFSSVVRIQKERGQRVVSTGPYAVVRHPGYAGGLLMVLSIGPCLGSLWALVPAFLACIVLVVRTHMEDETLRKELGGYREYCRKTRYRLIPSLW